MKKNEQGFVSGQHPSVNVSLNKRSGCKSKRKSMIGEERVLSPKVDAGQCLHLYRKPTKSILPWSVPPRKTDRLDEQSKTASE
ncbi:hypothetical protein [Bacteroides muris (ex Afrizal et al. 2022)]|uniref:hypothetical protein n=1 Tax=Bacteroides muris (ex Afrizal et al. 2022) TaxID=2516960 RepID=UPI0014426EED|nr:hypothetical protein [Bacteroides muris (ex Afrizal et al. 2022)]